MRLPLAASLLFAALPALAASRGGARLTVSGGYDSNARRDYSPREAELPTEGDAALSAVGSLEGVVTGERTQLGGNYDLGARRFLRLPSEDVIIQAAATDASVAVGRSTGFGLDLRGKDRRGGERDYTDLWGAAYLEVAPDPRLTLRLSGAGHRFVHWPAFAYSFASPEVAFWARYRFDRRHSVSVSGDAGWRRYNGQAIDGDGLPIEGRPRADFAAHAGVGYHYRGRFTLSVQYSYADQTSNSFGETTLRHRLGTTAGFRLPWRVTLLAQLVAQYSIFPDGVYLSPEISLVEDEESHNSASVKLVRPVSARVDAELKLAWYKNWLAGNGLDYDRRLALLGLTWRL